MKQSNDQKLTTKYYCFLTAIIAIPLIVKRIAIFLCCIFRREDGSDCGGVSTRGHGQREGPDGDKWPLGHAGNVGRVRSERSERSPPQSLSSSRCKYKPQSTLVSSVGLVYLNAVLKGKLSNTPEHTYQ